MSIPFTGVFYVARPLLKADEKKLFHTVGQKAEAKNFKVALRAKTPNKLIMETLSHNNDAVLKDTFAKHGVKYTYSPRNLQSPAPQPLTFKDKLNLFLSR